MGFVFDLANALRRLDLETIVFARHYLRQSLRQLPELVLGALLPVKRARVRAPVGAVGVRVGSAGGVGFGGDGSSDGQGQAVVRRSTGTT